ncbi:MAG: hypothetical protein WCW31_02915 [Patescibacteria group bacterium]|jgi:hypothetical protein
MVDETTQIAPLIDEKKALKAAFVNRPIFLDQGHEEEWLEQQCQAEKPDLDGWRRASRSILFMQVATSVELRSALLQALEHSEPMDFDALAAWGNEHQAWGILMDIFGKFHQARVFGAIGTPLVLTGQRRLDNFMLLHPQETVRSSVTCQCISDVRFPCVHQIIEILLDTWMRGKGNVKSARDFLCHHLVATLPAVRKERTLEYDTPFAEGDEFNKCGGESDGDIMNQTVSYCAPFDNKK